MSNINFEVSVSDKFTGLIFPNFCYLAHIIYCMQKEKNYLADRQGHARVL